MLTHQRKRKKFSTIGGVVLGRHTPLLAFALVLWGCAEESPPVAADAHGDAATAGDTGRLDAARDGAVRDGAVRDGAVVDGTVVDGTVVDAAAVDGAIPRDAAPDGALVDGSLPDAAPDAGPAVPPIEAPARTWTWVPIDGMRCANGQPTGIGVNLAPGARRMMIYLFGGGACWDAQSCYQDDTAAFIEAGFTAADFPGNQLDQLWFLNRAAPENLFADHHLVMVPYCTGDIHGGNRVAQYDGRATHHVGALNFDALASRLHATFPELERVVLAGGSAGGYGALLNWHRARGHFPRARVDMIDDGGAAIPPPQFPPARRTLWNQAWNLAGTLPADCPTCLADWSQLVPYNLARAPEARGALLTSLQDGVIAQYIGINGGTMQAGVEALVESVRAGYGAFLVPGDAHVLMAAPVIAGGQTVPQWLRAMQADDPAWGTVGPDPLPECGAFPTCNECAVCAAQEPCGAEFNRCNGIQGCVEAVVCALACPAADNACIFGCAAPFPGVGEAGLALYECVRCGVCGEDCGACP
jgi:hypothetical protein